MTTWLYQFQFFAFKTAKFWGRGPRDWDAENLGFLGTMPAVSRPRCVDLPDCPVVELDDTAMDDDDNGLYDECAYIESSKRPQKSKSGGTKHRIQAD